MRMRNGMLGALVILAVTSLGCVVEGGSEIEDRPSADAYHHLSDLAVGDCADLVRDADDLAILAVVRRSCLVPHDAEVIGIASHPTSVLAAYPSEAELLEWAEEACLAAFVDYVGASYSGSDLMAVYDVPTERSWLAGDRRSPCLVADLAGTKLVGSVRWAEPTDATGR